MEDRVASSQRQPVVASDRQVRVAPSFRHGRAILVEEPVEAARERVLEGGVTCPTDEELLTLLERDGGDVIAPLVAVRTIRDLGPAMFLDAARFAARRWQDGRTPSRIRLEAFRSFILPQLEGSDDDDARHLFEVLADVFDPPELHELRRTVRAMTRTTAHPVPSEPGRPQAVAG